MTYEVYISNTTQEIGRVDGHTAHRNKCLRTMSVRTMVCNTRVDKWNIAPEHSAILSFDKYSITVRQPSDCIDTQVPN